MDDTLWRIERSLRILEKQGEPRKPRTCVEQLGDRFALFTAELTDNGMVIRNVELLGQNLTAAMKRLWQVREEWLDIIPRRGENNQRAIVAAIRGLDRAVQNLRGRALHCRGSRLLTLQVVNQILNAAQRVALYSGDRPSVVADEAFAEAAMRIDDLLRLGRCDRMVA